MSSEMDDVKANIVEGADILAQAPFGLMKEELLALPVKEINDRMITVGKGLLALMAGTETAIGRGANGIDTVSTAQQKFMTALGNREADADAGAVGDVLLEVNGILTGENSLQTMAQSSAEVQRLLKEVYTHYRSMRGSYVELLTAYGILDDRVAVVNHKVNSAEQTARAVAGGMGT